MSTAGYRSRNRASRPAWSSDTGVGIPPTASEPRSSPRKASTASRAEVAAASVCRASSSSVRPASVSSTRRVVRANSGKPSSRSSERIDVDSADWLM